MHSDVNILSPYKLTCPFMEELDYTFLFTHDSPHSPYSRKYLLDTEYWYTYTFSLVESTLGVLKVLFTQVMWLANFSSHIRERTL